MAGVVHHTIPTTLNEVLRRRLPACRYLSNAPSCLWLLLAQINTGRHKSIIRSAYTDSILFTTAAATAACRHRRQLVDTVDGGRAYIECLCRIKHHYPDIGFVCNQKKSGAASSTVPYLCPHSRLAPKHTSHIYVPLLCGVRA